MVGNLNVLLGTSSSHFFGYAVTRLRVCYCMFKYTHLSLLSHLNELFNEKLKMGKIQQKNICPREAGTNSIKEMC